MTESFSVCHWFATTGLRLLAMHLLLTSIQPARADVTLTPVPTHVQESVGHAVPSPDGRFVAVCGLHVNPYVEPVPARSVGEQRELDVPCGKKVGTLVVSPDSRWVGGVGRDKSDRDHAFVWSAEQQGLICEFQLPESATYATSVRFSPASDVLYVGARNEVYECDFRDESLKAVINDARYYVQDLAAEPGKKTLAYCDRMTPFGLRRWSLTQEEELPSFFGDEQEQELGRWVPANSVRLGTSVDFSRDGSQMAVSVSSGVLPRLSLVYRFDASTGTELSKAVIPNRSIGQVRYVDNTKVLIVAGHTEAHDGGFGLIGPKSEELDDWVELGERPRGIAIDHAGDGHLTVGLYRKVLQWESSQWPLEWSSLFSDVP